MSACITQNWRIQVSLAHGSWTHGTLTLVISVDQGCKLMVGNRRVRATWLRTILRNLIHIILVCLCLYILNRAGSVKCMLLFMFTYACIHPCMCVVSYTDNGAIMSTYMHSWVHLCTQVAFGMCMLAAWNQCYWPLNFVHMN